jgi:hypothetical protein
MLIVEPRREPGRSSQAQVAAMPAVSIRPAMDPPWTTSPIVARHGS